MEHVKYTVYILASVGATMPEMDNGITKVFLLD